jgi:outer membrane immunogenic protein
MNAVSKKVLLASSASTAVIAGCGMPPHADAQTLPLGEYQWTGFYAGIHAGGIWSDAEHGSSADCGPFTNLFGAGGTPLADNVDQLDCTDRTAGAGPNTSGVFPTFELDDDYVAWTGEHRSKDAGVLAGGHLGFNWQAGRAVFGVEGDFSGGFGGKRSDAVTFDYFDTRSGDLLEGYYGSGAVSRETSLDWLSTIRGRAGVALGPQGRFLLYGTAGVAFAQFSDRIDAAFDTTGFEVSCDDCSFSGGGGDDGVRVGLALGAGGEFGLTPNLRLGAEYLFTHFGGDDGSVTFSANGGRQFDVQLGGVENVHTVRARLTWAFGGP